MNKLLTHIFLSCHIQRRSAEDPTLLSFGAPLAVQAEEFEVSLCLAPLYCPLMVSVPRSAS